MGANVRVARNQVMQSDLSDQIKQSHFAQPLLAGCCDYRIITVYLHSQRATLLPSTCSPDFSIGAPNGSFVPSGGKGKSTPGQ